MRLNITKVLLLIFFLFLTLDSDLYAVSLSPELIEKLRKEGRLEEVVKQANLAREKGVWQPSTNPPLRLRKGGSSAVDTLKPIVICVDFDDNVHSRDTSEFSLLLFSKGFAFPSGSMRDYYLENSYGKLDVVGGVTGWYRMPEDYSYYVWGNYGIGSSPHNAQKLAEDAVNAADPVVDFSDYDYDGDGWVDGLIIVHAGPGAEETGDPDDIWSHSWSMTSTFHKDGVYLRAYNMDPEIHSGGALIDIGVFAHEFGHTLGLQDLYDTDNSSEGLGRWSIMASGSWNNNGKTPAHLDAWCKYKLGWIDIDTLTVNLTNVAIPQVETSPKAYRLWTSGGGGSEYFLVENRQKTRFDASLPGEGLLIFHVDEGGSNRYEWCPGDPATPHYKVALEQADGEFRLEGCYSSANRGDAGDPFPGNKNKQAFDDTITLSSRTYTGAKTQVAVWNISTSDSVMHANLDVTWSRPCLYLEEFTLDDSPPKGNGNGKPERGETVKIYLTISNIWLPMTGTAVTGSVDTAAGITFTDDSSYLGDIGTGGSANNYSDSMEFVVDSLFPERLTIFTLHVQGNTTFGTYSLDFNEEVWAGNTDVSDFDEEDTNIPKSIELFQNYPNPFNPTTSIQFAVKGGPSPLHTTLKIYNLRGQLVKTLLDEDKPGGNYTLLWDGRDEGGKAVSSGIYFYKLTAGSFSEIKRMVLLK